MRAQVVVSDTGTSLPEPVSFIIPCFNEHPEVLRQSIERLRSTMDNYSVPREYEVIVVDDGSSDHDYSRMRDGITLLRHQSNRGYGASLKTGIKIARHKYIGIVDADATYPIEDFVQHLELIPEYDMVIGARSWREIGTARKPAKKVLTRFASYVASRQIPDLNSGMRVFRRALFDEYARLYPDGFSFSSTLTMVGMSHNYDVKFLPIVYGKRSGVSKIHPVKDTARFISQLSLLALHFKPLRVFVPLAMLFGLSAVGRAIRDVLLTNAIGTGALMLALLGVHALFFGLIAEMINKK